MILKITREKSRKITKNHEKSPPLKILGMPRGGGGGLENDGTETKWRRFAWRKGGSNSADFEWRNLWTIPRLYAEIIVRICVLTPSKSFYLSNFETNKVICKSYKRATCLSRRKKNLLMICQLDHKHHIYVRWFVFYWRPKLSSSSGGFLELIKSQFVWFVSTNFGVNFPNRHNKLCRKERREKCWAA